jgi:pyrimidine 5'-nucleotidase
MGNSIYGLFVVCPLYVEVNSLPVLPEVFYPWAMRIFLTSVAPSTIAMTIDIALFVSSALASLFYVHLLKRSRDAKFLEGISSENELDDLQLLESLRNRTSLNANELICHVTSDNTVVPNGILRSDMRLNNLWHRATYTLIILMNPPITTDVTNDWSDDDHNNNENDPLSFQNTYVLVQRRSSMKDYCPMKLDPLPGGVVGHDESYLDNVIRELQEEMGITISSPNGESTDELQWLFTFPYEDERVRVWGEFYVYKYYGSMKDLILQKEEVDSVLCLSLQELKDTIEMTPNEFMPDACYAMQLYYQHVIDRFVKRRLLHGYSSSNLDSYKLRPKPKVIFFDCDDCLYFDQWKTANQLTRKIDEWCIMHGLPSGKAYELYKQYGTALRGLLAEGYIEHNDHAIDEFLREVHDIPIHDLIQPDPELRQLLLQIDPSIPKYIFTASVREHAERCIRALGIDDLFVDIIDCKVCQLETKHSEKSFHIAMEFAGIKDDNAIKSNGGNGTLYYPESCLFFDDNIKNIEAARNIGWRSILVGTVGRDCGTTITTEHAEHEIDRIHHLRSVLPELFDC